MRPLNFILPNTYIGTMALGLTQPLTEIFLGIKVWPPPRKADNLSTICEPTAYKMWDIATLWASTAC
jgi:hypothetical protein